MDAAVGPVDRLAFSDELLRIGLAEAARIGETSSDFLVAIKLREIGFIGDGDDEHLAAFLGSANAPNFDAGTLAGKEAEIGVDVLGVIENIGRADDVMESGVGRGNARAEREMVNEFGAEERFSGELLDFLGVLRVVGESARAGLGKADGRAETQGERNAE